MKKIRLLALLLAILMVLSVALVACGGGDDDDNNKDPNKGDEPTDPENPDKPVGDQTYPDGSRVGYEMYFHFNAAALGRLPALEYTAALDEHKSYQRPPYDIYLKAVDKPGGSYVVERKVGSDTDNCLLIHREAGVNSDPYMDILAATALENLDSKFTLSFKVRLEDGFNGSPTAIRGRKVVSGAAQFLDFIKFDDASIYDCNGGIVYGPESSGYTQGWHTVHLFVDDSNRSYDIYVDGYKVTSAPVKYNNENYPDKAGADLDVLRFTVIANGALGETFFYLDDIAVQNTDNASEYAVGENVLGGGIVHYDTITMNYKNGLFNPSLEDMNNRLSAIGYEKFKQEIFSSKLLLSDGIALAKKTADGKVVDLFGDYGVQLGYYDDISVFTSGDAVIKVWSESEGGKFVGKVSFDANDNDAANEVTTGTYSLDNVLGKSVIVLSWDGATPKVSDKELVNAAFDEATGVLTFYTDTNLSVEVASFKLNKTVNGVYTSEDGAASFEVVDDSLADVTLGDVSGEYPYVINDDGTITVVVDAADESKNVNLGYIVGKNTVTFGDVKLLPEEKEVDVTLGEGEKYLLAFGNFPSMNNEIKFEDPEFVEGYRDPAVQAQFKTVVCTFYAPEEIVLSGYRLMLYIGCGNNEGGISYWSKNLNAGTDYKAGWNTYSFEISSLGGGSRSPDLIRFSDLRMSTSGWSNGPALDGKGADGYKIYFEEYTFIGYSTEKFANAAEGKENCTHANTQIVHVDIEEGKTEYACGHAYCVHGDYYINKCSDCGYESPVKDRAVSSGSVHNFDSVLQIKYPSCGVEGYTYYECKGCGYEKVVETFAALEHSYYVESSVEGNYVIKDMLCTICGHKTKAQGYSELIDFQTKVDDNEFSASQYISTLNYPTAKYGSYTASGQANGASAFFEITHKYAVLEAKPIAEGSNVMGFEYSRNPDSSDASFFQDAYVDLNTATNDTNILIPMGSSFVFEIDLKLGNKGADGKYPQINSQIMDRGYGGSSKTNVELFSMNPDGNFAFKGTTYTYPLSETEFTNFAFYLKPAENVVELYVNGVLAETKAMTASVEKAMTVGACDWRVTYVTGKTNEKGASFWFNNMIYYITNKGPACVLVDKSDIVNANREVKLHNEALEDLTYPLAVNGEDVVGYVPADYRNNKYVFEATFNGTDLADGVLLEGWKRNSGYDYYENLLEIKDGKLYCCGVLVSTTTENVKIALLLDDDTKAVKVYVNNALIPGGAFAYQNAFYSESNAIKGFVFNAEVGAYTVTDVRVYSGNALKPIPVPETPAQ